MNYCSEPRIAFRKLDITSVVLEAIIAVTIITGQGALYSVSWVSSHHTCSSTAAAG